MKKSAKTITGNNGRRVKPAMHQERSLPMELSGHIIQYLQDDMATMIRCGLVCRTWLTISRPHVFQKICLDSRNADEFASLIMHSMSTIPPSVQKLELVPSPPPDPRWLRRLVPFLGFLADVSFLQVENVDWSALHSNSRKNFVSTFNTLTELYLGNMTFVELSEVVTLISSFPLLESLALSQVSWTSSQSAGARHRLPPSLKKLKLLSTQIHPILSWILSHDQPHRIKTLGLTSIRDADSKALRQYMAILGPRLEAITMGFQEPITYSYMPIDPEPEVESTSSPSSRTTTNPKCVVLSLLTGLRTVTLSNFINHADLVTSSSSSWAPYIIESLNSLHMERVILEISLSDMGELDAHSTDWERLDYALDRPVYANLQGVHVQVQGSVDRKEISRFIQTKLPICHGQGLLYIG